MADAVTLDGADQLAEGFRAMVDTRDIVAASGVAARTVAAAAQEFIPSDSGELAGSIEFTEDDRTVTIGSNSPYARWFHVPHLSEGGVLYAKKSSTRGRSYGQRIPDNPFMIDAAQSVEEEIVSAYGDAVEGMIGRLDG